MQHTNLATIHLRDLTPEEINGVCGAMTHEQAIQEAANVMNQIFMAGFNVSLDEVQLPGYHDDDDWGVWVGPGGGEVDYVVYIQLGSFGPPTQNS